MESNKNKTAKSAIVIFCNIIEIMILMEKLRKQKKEKIVYDIDFQLCEAELSLKVLENERILN